MNRCIHRRSHGITVQQSFLVGKVSLCALLAFLLLFSPFWAERAQANDYTYSGTAAMTLDTLGESFLARGTIPLAGESKLDLFLMPSAVNGWSAAVNLPPVRSSHAETLRASGNIKIAGGVGKRWLVVSAELYDNATDTWLTKSQISTARGQSSSSLPNISRAIVWCGIVVPF